MILFGGKCGLTGKSAIVARAGTIVRVCSDEQALALKIDGEEVYDLRGGIVLPGFADGHGHVLGLGMRLSTLHLHDRASAHDVAGAVREWIAHHGADHWVIGMGWDQEKWADKNFPHREILDAVAPDTPVYLTRIDGHAAWVNGEALRRAGVDRAAEIDGGVIVGDSARLPTGVLIDNAMQCVTSVMPQLDDTRIEKALRLAIAHLHRQGITLVHDMDVDPNHVPIYQRVLEEPGNHLRISSWLRGQNFEWQRAWDRHDNRSVRTQFDSDWLHVDGVKLYLDGALGSRGAWLNAPYDDAPGTCGLQLFDRDVLNARIDVALADGYAVAAHAIGDAATHAALDAYERVRARDRNVTLRIEHAQVVAPEDIQRFAALGVIASVQPLQRTSDRAWLPARLGARAAWTFPLRDLHDCGAHLVGGSDFPIEAADCIAGIRAARSGEEGQRLDAQSSIDLFTLWARRATSFYGMSGMLAPGMAADLTILSDNLDDPQCAIAATVIAGEFVCRAPGLM